MNEEPPMTRVFALAVMCAAIVTSSQGQEPATVARPQATSAAASAAVMLSLDEYFSNEWRWGKVYIQANTHVPPGLARVGKYEAEVITEEALKKRFAGKEQAPAFARINAGPAEEDGRTYYDVSISYTGLLTRGAKSIPLGGGKFYRYRIEAGKAELVKTGVVRY
jgi:hypothetical protein